MPIADYLVSTTEAPKIADAPPKALPDVKADEGVVVMPTDPFPTHMIVLWSGKIRNDAHGNVFPDVTPSVICLGQPGVKKSHIPGELDYTEFLSIKQEEGFIRIDQIIGLPPVGYETNREASVKWARTLLTEENLLKLGDKVQWGRNPKLEVSGALLDLAEGAKYPAQRERYDKIIHDVVAEYDRIRELLAMVRTRVSSAEPAVPLEKNDTLSVKGEERPARRKRTETPAADPADKAPPPDTLGGTAE